MNVPVIACERLGKQYSLGERQRTWSLREGLSMATSGIARRLVSLTAAAASSTTVWALRDVSFEVEAGEVIGIIGRNGAGKSTLLRILSRITEPAEGHAIVRGRIGSLLEVGTGFHPELTGRENVYFNGVILGMRKAEVDSRFDEIVDFAGVERFIDTPVKHYSSGMQLRLAFAVAVHLQTDILLIDEVLAVGDMEFQRRCIGKMGDISRSGRTVLFVSHNLTSVGLLCQRGLLLDGGRKVFEGPIGDVVRRYMESVRRVSGEVIWKTLEAAPGDDRVRLRGVRVLVDGVATGDVDIDRGFDIEVTFWNLESNALRLISIHLYNEHSVCILASGNMPGATLRPDAWWGRRYPIGLFRSICSIPGGLLNDGPHTIAVFINGSALASDNVLVVRDVLGFEVRETGGMRSEYSGPWLGAVRPRLAWSTEQVS